ncbi:hypothetical protein DFH08DRAFT_886016, partial [Mycena albidolilacea]
MTLERFLFLLGVFKDTSASLQTSEHHQAPSDTNQASRPHTSAASSPHAAYLPVSAHLPARHRAACPQAQRTRCRCRERADVLQDDEPDVLGREVEEEVVHGGVGV